MAIWRDSRTSHERELDAGYARAKNAGRRLDAALVVSIENGRRPMSKLAAIGERIAAKKAAHDRMADTWAQRLNAIEKLEPQAFAAADSVLAEREADLAQLESTVRALSNLGPLADSQGSSGGSGGDKK